MEQKMGEHKKNRRKPDHFGRRESSFDFYVLLFFLLSAAGWLWEVLLYFVTEQTFVNRGVYHGPYLPIYGVGGILLYLLLHRLRKRPVFVFLYASLICLSVEYFASWFLEKLWKVRWWDYSNHVLHINGRICLLGGIFFGMGGTLLVCWALPYYEKLFRLLPAKKRIVLCLLLVAIFTADAAYAAVQPNIGYGITT